MQPQPQQFNPALPQQPMLLPQQMTQRPVLPQQLPQQQLLQPQQPQQQLPQQLPRDKPQDEARGGWADELRKQKAAAQEVLERQRAWAASMQQQHIASRGPQAAARPSAQAGKPEDEARSSKAEAKTPERRGRWASKDPSEAPGSDARPGASRAAEAGARSTWTPSRPERKEWWADMKSPSGTVGSIADGLERAAGESEAADRDAARRPLRRRGKVSEYGAHAPVEEPQAAAADPQASQHQPRTRRRGKFINQEEAASAEAARGSHARPASSWEEGGSEGWRGGKGAGKAASSYDTTDGSAASRRRRRR